MEEPRPELSGLETKKCNYRVLWLLLNKRHINESLTCSKKIKVGNFNSKFHLGI